MTTTSLIAARLVAYTLQAAPHVQALVAATAAPAPPPAATAPPIAPPTAPIQVPNPLQQATSSSTATTTGGEFPTVLLSAIIWSTALAALIILLLPQRTADQRGRIRVMALFGAAAPAVMAIVGMNYQINQEFTGGTTPSFEERHGWVSALAVHSDYHLAVDGISLPLLLLTTVLFVVAVLASWRVQTRVRSYFALLLLLETAVSGVLCSFDHLVFLMFWLGQPLLGYLLVDGFGGPGRGRAARRLFTHLLLADSALVLGVLLLGFEGAQHSFDFLQVNTVALTAGIGAACFWLTFLAFAARLPLVPLHTWFSDAVAEAAPAAGMIVVTCASVVGGYAAIRISLSAFPAAAHRFSLVLAVLAVLTAAWGAVSALAEDDLRRLVGHVGVAQAGVVFLAISAGTTVALNGAVLQLVAGALAMAMLALLAGSVEERARTRSLRRLGGLAWQTPRLMALWALAVATAVGVPLLAGFSALFMVATGSFPAHRVATCLVLASTAVTAWALLRAVERALLGPPRDAWARVRDASTLDLLALVPLGALVVIFGVFPGRVVPMINNGVLSVIARLGNS